MPSNKLTLLLQTPTLSARRILKRRGRPVKTTLGRVVYDRPTHHFTQRDLDRITKAVAVETDDLASFIINLIKFALDVALDLLKKKKGGKSVSPRNFIAGRIFPGLTRIVLDDLSGYSDSPLDLLRASFELALPVPASTIKEETE